MMLELSVVNWLWGGLIAWLSFLVFSGPLRHRSRYWVRCLCMLPAALAVLAPLLLYAHRDILWPGHLLALPFFFCSTLFCCNIKWGDAVYAAIWEIILVQSIYEIVALAQSLQQDFAFPYALRYGLLMVVSLVGLLAARYALPGVIVSNGAYHVGPRQLTSAVIIGLLFIMLFDVLRHNLKGGAPIIYMIIIIVSQVYGVSILCMQTGLFRKAALQKELDAMNLLYERQREQYALAKQNIKIINRKCHELKVQIAALREQTHDTALQESLRQAEESVRIYDSIAKTGNEVLDTLLTEKSLLCGARGIKIHCVAEGALLRFMQATDLYALLSEALENAIDAVAKLPDPDERMIDMQVYARQGFLVVNIANPLQEPLKMRDGFPLSTKGQGLTNGWGIRSMNNIVQKYGGTLSVETENNLFTLHIIFPEQTNA